ncbi:MAG: hypothetical protein ABSB95_00635 [Dissulfurispiraceae bacterium]
MKGYQRILIMSAIIFCLMLPAIQSTALAGQLDWTTQDVYFRHHVLFIKGFFTNNSHDVITHINTFNVHVKFLRGSDWHEYAASTFEDLDVRIRPHDSLNWTFKIIKVDPEHFDKYDVQWDVNFDYHERHRR